MGTFNNPTGYIGGQVTITDLTHPSAIPSGSTINSISSTTIVASHPVTVSNGDVIQYQAPGNLTEAAGALLWQADFYARTKSDTAGLASLPIIYFIGTSVPNSPGLPADLATVTDSHQYQGFGQQVMCGQYISGGGNCNFPNLWVSPGFQNTTPGSYLQWVSETGNPTQAQHYGGDGSSIDFTSVGPMQLNDLFDFYFMIQRWNIINPSFATFLQSAPPYVFVYELFDEDPAVQAFGFGLFDNQKNPKASAVGIHNMISILKDPGSTFSPGSLSYGTAGTVGPAFNANGTQIGLMEKRNGTFEFVVENEQLTYSYITSGFAGCTNTPVTINLATAPTTVNIYDPIQSISPINTYAGARSVTLQSCMDPLIVEVIPEDLVSGLIGAVAGRTGRGVGAAVQRMDSMAPSPPLWLMSPAMSPITSIRAAARHRPAVPVVPQRVRPAATATHAPAYRRRARRCSMPSI